MRRREFLAGGLCSASAKGRRRPNVVVILADDLGYADLGVTGCEDIPTPHIDSIARNGVRFTDGYVSAPVCSPSRAGLLTGRYQQRFGHEFNAHTTPLFFELGGDPGRLGLPLSETTFADRMRAAGYRTAIVGKWHLGTEKVQYHPLRRGFQEFYGFLDGGHPYLPGDLGSKKLPILRGYEAVELREYLTDALAKEAVHFIDRSRHQPFFLYFTPNAVHTPMQATAKYLDRFAHIGDARRRSYAAMLSALDDGVGAVLGKLRQCNLEDDTLIFVLSDNGGPTNKLAVNGSRNTPFRGSKGDLWEGGIRVPFFAQWKGRIRANSVFDKTVLQLDLLPTSLAAAGVPVPADWKLDGVNLLPYLSGMDRGEPHRAAFWRFGPVRAARVGEWKIVRTWDNSAVELFNLRADPGERQDLSRKQPMRLQDLQAQWSRWNAGLAQALWPMPEPVPAPLPAEQQWL
jgi:arylsulfatase A-like enzyme